MKIILISLIIILIYYAIFRNSCGCEGFENDKKKRKKLFNEIADIAKKVSKKSDRKKAKCNKNFVNAIFNSSNNNDIDSDCSYSDNKSDKQSSNKSGKLFVKTSNNVSNKKNITKGVKPEAEAKLTKGQLLINKLLAERSKSRAEMKIASDKLFGKAVPESVVDSSYDDKFVVNSSLGQLETVLPKLENKDKEGKIHLAELPKCKVPMKTNLINNYNHIINTGNEIYQDILKPESNKTFIHNVRHNLMQVAWVKSSLQWHGENIKLEIRFTNINPANGQRVHIVFPLILVDTYIKIEKFTDTYYNLSFNEFKQNASNKIVDLKKGVMFPVLEDKLNSFTKDLTTKHITKLDTKLKKLTDKQKKLKTNLLNKKKKLKVKIPIFKVNGEQIISENKMQIDTIKTIIDIQKQQEQIIKNVDDIKLEKDYIIKNPIQENAMIKELKKDSDSIVNQMKIGMTPNIVDIKEFKKNNTFNKQKVFHEENTVKNILKNSEIRKINMTTIPKSVNLNDIKKKLESTNFNFVTKKIKYVKYSYSDIDTLLNLNSLIVDASIIPDYMCCKPTIGQLINMDFSQIEKKIIAQDFFYYTHGNDGSLIFITQPHPFEKKIGNIILENLISDTKLVSS